MSILMTEYDYATDLAVQKEEAYEDGLFAGLEQGAYQKALETARSMLSRMLPTDLVVDCTGLPLETVLELKQKL